MNMKPKLSVLMSVFNQEKFLRNSIQSILNQSYKNFEFLIVDDFSTDNSLDIIKEFQNKDSRIKIFKNKKNCQNYRSSQTTGNYCRWWN